MIIPVKLLASGKQLSLRNKIYKPDCFVVPFFGSTFDDICLDRNDVLQKMVSLIKEYLADRLSSLNIKSFNGVFGRPIKMSGLNTHFIIQEEKAICIFL